MRNKEENNINPELTNDHKDFIKGMAEDMSTAYKIAYDHLVDTSANYPNTHCGSGLTSSNLEKVAMFCAEQWVLTALNRMVTEEYQENMMQKIQVLRGMNPLMDIYDPNEPKQ
jgi:hypothetical protein